MLFLSHWSEWSSSKSLQIINAGEGGEKRKPSYIVGGNVNSQRNAIFDSSFVLEDAEKIAITIPYNVDNQAILTARVGDETMFEVFPNASNFTCSVKNKNANYLIV